MPVCFFCYAKTFFVLFFYCAGQCSIPEPGTGKIEQYETDSDEEENDASDQEEDDDKNEELDANEPCSDVRFVLKVMSEIFPQSFV